MVGKQPLGAMLHSLDRVLHNVRSQPSWKSLRRLEMLQALWPEVVGAAVAAQTFPVKLQRKVLSVAVSSPSWGQNLSYQRQLILKKLNPHLDTPIQDIRFSPNALQHAQQAQRDRKIFAASNERAPQSFGRSPASASTSPPKDAAEAFQRWALRVKQAQRTLPLCPNCARPSDPTELKRWYVCSFCRIQQQQR
ncbi:MAG: DciA family protein [Cyanobacteria bacterium J06648_11]